MKQRLRARFRLQVFLQVLFLLVSLGVLAWLLIQTPFGAVPMLILLLIIAQVAFLLKGIESHVDSLEEFFAAINYEDFTRRFVTDDIDIELKDAFNKIIGKFQDARVERDTQAAYLATVVRHVPVPFFAARPSGEITLANNPARRLTGLNTFQTIDQLAEIDPKLPAELRSMAPGTQSMVEASLRGVPAELRVSVSEIRLDGDVERLFSIENISGELTAREATAWRNLIRVLTHEIMNTLTPVTSLAQTTAEMLDTDNAHDEIRNAVKTIARRSEGLTNFVMRYRELLKVPEPRFTTLRVSDVLENAITLMSVPLEHVDVTRNVTPTSLEISADPALLDQVLVNLLRNSIDAMENTENPKLTLGGRLEFGKSVISVSDNGPGIDPVDLEQIFVPFFTTKRSGSGIGLSLCKQIMTAHAGNVVVESTGGGTTVRLVF